MKCRYCGAQLGLTLIDLGSAPPSNAYLTEAGLEKPEPWYPLRVLVCEQCWLVQTKDFAEAHELFGGDYAYFSSYSSSWVQHARRYVEAMSARFSLGPTSTIVEVASNDGYLLQYAKSRGIPCLGIEPTARTAAAARAKGIEVLEDFFGESLGIRLATEGRSADLMTANNVLAHVPNINDFLRGFTALLKPTGVATFEFPHLLRLLDGLQFDTIYHEHFSYLSMLAVDRIMRSAGLVPFAVEELLTHGGSLRVFAQRADTGRYAADGSIAALMARERATHLDTAARYAGFQAKAERIRDDLLIHLIEAKRAGRTVAAYGAAAKGNTLLNFAGVRPDLVRFVVDRNPVKQGKFMPGSRIPIVPPTVLQELPPETLLVLPWNILPEVRADHSLHVKRGMRFLTAVPELRLY